MRSSFDNESSELLTPVGLPYGGGRQERTVGGVVDAPLTSWHCGISIVSVEHVALGTAAGSVRFDSSHLDNVTKVVLWRDVFGNAGFSNVASTMGDFSGIALGTQALMATPWIFNPSTATPGLWSVGGFTFDLFSSTIVTQTSTFLNVTGTGIISGNGFDPTVASWAFTVQNAGGNHQFFSFSANAATQGVPDAGSGAALLGIGLGVVEFIRRKLRLCT